MKSEIKALVIGVYAVIGLLVALYQHWWGYASHQGFAYNLGQGIVWPALLIPSVGKLISGLLLVGIIAVIVMRSK